MGHGREGREIHTGVKINFGDGFVGGRVNWFSVDVDCGSMNGRVG